MEAPCAADLAFFAAPIAEWFATTLGEPTAAQRLAWPAIAAGKHALLVAPTGSGKTLAAFLNAIHRLGFGPPAPRPVGLARNAAARTRVVYISPIKALAADIERNLLAPLTAIAARAAAAGVEMAPIEIAVRSGDTPAKLRNRIARGQADILITTPESLYLMLTSNAAAALQTVETVIIDEIHALAPNERGAHLALSLERLDALCGRATQRIGLSATQKPLDEIARFLGGVQPVTILDAGAPKHLQLRIEMPFAPTTHADDPGAKAGPATHWDAIHARLTEIVLQHRSTIIFVNSRRLAERIAQAVNTHCPNDATPLAFAHHGSVAKEQRLQIEAALKAGALRAIVATSSLELGIDMGTVDMVVQLEPAPSVASALQRIGRASHHVGGVSSGVLIPKHRGEVLACASLAEAMQQGNIEAIRYLRNPLDVLAQQIVAMVAMAPYSAPALFALVRRCACFAELPRADFDATLDMLSGFFAIEALGDARPRITYDRDAGMLYPRDGAKRIAVANAGTIADRGLYGVYRTSAVAPEPATPAPASRGRKALRRTTPSAGRIGELDEEMVFESKVGDRFLLGASTWRIDEITADRVMVSPAPGEPGRMPFWRGENAMRPYATGQRLGAFTRELLALPTEAAHHKLVAQLNVAPNAAEAALQLLADQQAQSAVPTDQRVVVELTRDELGDWRVCVLGPFGAQVFAPWAMLTQARAQAELNQTLDILWHNDGFVIRFSDISAVTPEQFLRWLFIDPAAVESELLHLLAHSAMFAARFREAAGRALLLPKRLPGRRTPLWHTRKRAQDLLRGALAVQHFPLLVEAYRKCLVDTFDVNALRSLLGALADGACQVAVQHPARPSLYANHVLFAYTGNFMYEGDAPVAERAAQTLAIDPHRLRELVGDVALRDVLLPEVIAQLDDAMQRRDVPPHSLDAWHDHLLRIGDLAAADHPEAAQHAARLVAAGRALALTQPPLWIPREYLERYRAGLRVEVGNASAAEPASAVVMALAPTSTEAGAHTALLDIVLRYSRHRVPFTCATLQARYQRSASQLLPILRALVQRNELVAGRFTPGVADEEFVHIEVLQRLRARSASRWRKQLAPADAASFVRFVHGWHGVSHPRSGLDALLDTIEKLQDLPILASQLESEILPARVANYTPGMLDTLLAAGEVVWRGRAASGERDGKIALYLADAAPAFIDLAATRAVLPTLSATATRILQVLQHQGAVFFGQLRAALQQFTGDIHKALWELCWQGLINNDSMWPLRDLLASTNVRSASGGRRNAHHSFRSRRVATPEPLGRWAITPGILDGVAVAPSDSSRSQPPTPRLAQAKRRAADTHRATSLAKQWLLRHGHLCKSTERLESDTVSFASLYPVFRALEDAGQLFRGAFVADLPSLQFASASAVSFLRSVASAPPALPREEIVVLAATDCANPWGAVLPWPAVTAPRAPKLREPRRVAGAHVFSLAGQLLAWLSADAEQLVVFFTPDQHTTAAPHSAAVLATAVPDNAPAAPVAPAAHLARRLAGLLQQRRSLGQHAGFRTINNLAATQHWLAAYLTQAGLRANGPAVTLPRITGGR